MTDRLAATITAFVAAATVNDNGLARAVFGPEVALALARFQQGRDRLAAGTFDTATVEALRLAAKGFMAAARELVYRDHQTLTRHAQVLYARVREVAAIAGGRCLLGQASHRRCTGPERVRVSTWFPGDGGPVLSDWGCPGHAGAEYARWDHRIMEVRINGDDQAAVAAARAEGERLLDRCPPAPPQDWGNPVCGHPMAWRCDGCHVCTSCDGCYCDELHGD
ncbi:hypothetical protein LO763_19635 [Glycomyces sp. A-F 0318]|uniref:hypothetical protein n=1 Tax=Glycomyces amatae TaxID=2881355 RepID=UPI001E62C85C|nr:hypothetical protein [Glycomyces amatae]MCD0445824.1 hypothetical protein [Glycomyces amatae]